MRATASRLRAMAATAAWESVATRRFYAAVSAADAVITGSFTKDVRGQRAAALQVAALLWAAPRHDPALDGLPRELFSAAWKTYKDLAEKLKGLRAFASSYFDGLPERERAVRAITQLGAYVGLIEHWLRVL